MSDKGIAFPIVVFLGFLGLVFGGYFIWGQVNRLLVRQQYGERIATMCTTVNTSVTNLANAPKTPKPWRALVLDGEKKHSWMGKLPKDARANGADAVDVVVCVTDKSKSVIQECPYRTLGSGTLITVRRVQSYQDLVVLNAESGKRIASLRVWGTAPDGCQNTHVGQDNDEIVGPSPTSTDFYYTLMNLIWR